MNETALSKQELFISDNYIETDNYSLLSTSALLSRVEVPSSHKRAADNYMVIKKIYGFSAVCGRISLEEKALLAKYDFSELEASTIKQINEEIKLLKKWSCSVNETLRQDADEIIQIRVKELKFLNASKYIQISNEIYKGYLALEKYLESL